MTKVMTSIHHLKDTLEKTCLVALSYFDSNNQALKQSVIAGKVIAVDKEVGITLMLFTENESLPESQNKTAKLIIPADLSCWFTAPQGDFHTSNGEAKITNPDFLVTWDIHQTKEDKKEGEQQWWQWFPRTEAPQINA
jgi:hypothetical protein